MAEKYLSVTIEGKNVFKCLSEPEKPMAEPKKKNGEFKIDTNIIN